MNIKEQLQSAIDYCNAKLSAKGVAEQATSVVDIGNKIESIQSQDTGVGSRQWWIDMCAEKTYFAHFFSNTSIIECPLIDTSKGTNFVSMFQDCSSLTTIPKFDISNAASLSRTFNNCTSLITIPKLNASKVSTFASAFANCVSLVHISFVENSIHKAISFVDSPKLSNDSINSIINGLATVTTTQTITFHSTVTQKLTDEQKQIIINKGWKYQ